MVSQVKEKNAIVCTVNVEEQAKSEPIEDSNSDVLVAMKMIVDSIHLEPELMCSLCHEIFFKPVTGLCGHTYCRCCILNVLLSKTVEDEPSCPTCRRSFIHFSAFCDLTSAININVSLWNIIQLVNPKKKLEIITQKEDKEFKIKLDECIAKYKVYELHQAANQYHQLYRPHHLRSDSEEDDDTHRIAEGFEEVAVDMETLENGCMITRNILVKGDEVNIDGYQSMRLAMCLNGRPEVFRSYTASQQISLAVLCMEEDEVQDTGFPIVMSHDEEDDELVLPDYFNNIHLKVKNEDGDVILERERGAYRGMVCFPQLRLDVPSGTYTFCFTENLYGLSFTITAPVEQQGSLTQNINRPSLLSDHNSRNTNPYILEESRFDLDAEGEEEEEEEEDTPSEFEASGDSFIVDDEEEIQVEEGSESISEEEWSSSSDERRRLGRRRKRRRKKRASRDDIEEEEDEELQQEFEARRQRIRRPIIDDDEEEDGEEEANNKPILRRSRPVFSDSDGEEDYQISSDNSPQEKDQQRRELQQGEQRESGFIIVQSSSSRAEAPVYVLPSNRPALFADSEEEDFDERNINSSSYIEDEDGAFSLGDDYDESDEVHQGAEEEDIFDEDQ